MSKILTFKDIVGGFINVNNLYTITPILRIIDNCKSLNCLQLLNLHGLHQPYYLKSLYNEIIHDK